MTESNSGPVLPTRERERGQTTGLSQTTGLVQTAGLSQTASKRPTAYLEFLELTDFKSYSGHHVLGPLKRGLNCIVGSNGSGKSNLMDAICFVLGVETKFLRGLRLNDLGYRREGGGGTRSAEVVMRLRVPDETDKTRLASFGRRAVDGKTSQFLIEGKPVDRAAYLKALAQYNILPRVQNCIVSQGQVEAWSLNTDKEKTQMFDEVSGSAQYKEKYETLQKDIQQIKLTMSRINQEATTLQREYRALKCQWEELKAWQALEEQVKKVHADIYTFRLYVNESAGNRLRGRKEAIEAEIAHLEERSTALDAKQRAKEEQRREVAAELEKLEQRKSELEAEERQQQTKVEDLQTKAASFQAEIEKEEANKKAKEEEIEQLYKEYNEIGEEWVQLIDERTAKTQQLDARIKANAFTKLPEKKRQMYLKEKEKVSLKTSELQGKWQQLFNQIELEERELRGMEPQVGRAKAEAEKASQAYEECNHTVETMQKKLAEVETNRDTLQTAFEQLSQQRGELREKKDQLQTELEKNQHIVISFSQYRSEDSRAARFRQTLERLKTEIPGVYDRVTGLCELNNQRYATAVSTALGFQADSVVVDTFATAKRAVELCKRMQVPPVEFLPLDTIKSHPMDMKLRNYSDVFTPILDVIQFDSKFQKIFDYILEDTVLVDNLDDARRVAFDHNKKMGLSLKIVTVDGQTILKNFNIKLQGARSGQMDRFAQKQRDTAVEHCERLKKELGPIETEYRRIEQLFVKTETEFTHCKVECDQLASSLRNKNVQQKLLLQVYKERETELERANALMQEMTSAIENWTQEAADLRAKISKIEEEFLKTEELVAIQKAEIEMINLKNEFEKEIIKIKDKENMLQVQLNNILMKLGGDAPENSGIDEVMNRIELAFNNPQAVVKDYTRAITKLKTDLAKVERDEATEFANLSYIKEQTEQVSSNVKDKTDTVNNLALAVHEINVDRKRTFHKLSNLALEFKTTEQELDLLDQSGVDLIKEVVLRNIRVPVKNGTFEDFCDLFENPDTFMGDADTPMVELDFSGLPEDLRNLRTNEEIVEAQGILEKRYKALKDDLQAKGNQNHKAEEAYEEVKEKLRVVNQNKDRLKKEHDKKEKDLQKTSDIRKDKFMQCFLHTQIALKEIYATLTEPPKSDFSAEGTAATIFAKHFSESVGGSASLELEDATAEEPFNHGVIFTAMPYGKRYTEMELLSGGEKSMATLALLFSLQSYRQSPFVVLDEVDAALDAANVDALRRFLQRAKFQVVIVTLKEEMYCHADAIIGVYKDQVAESSETVTLDVQAYPLAVRPSPPQMTTLVN